MQIWNYGAIVWSTCVYSSQWLPIIDLDGEHCMNFITVISPTSACFDLNFGVRYGITHLNNRSPSLKCCVASSLVLQRMLEMLFVSLFLLTQTIPRSCNRSLQGWWYDDITHEKLRQLWRRHAQRSWIFIRVMASLHWKNLLLMTRHFQ
jgi:hypothetical protein